jgi:hypothetical protein
VPICGAEGIQTPDPLNANSQRHGQVSALGRAATVGEDRRLIGRLLHPYVRTGARAAGETRTRA